MMGTPPKYIVESGIVDSTPGRTRTGAFLLGCLFIGMSLYQAGNTWLLKNYGVPEQAEIVTVSRSFYLDRYRDEAGVQFRFRLPSGQWQTGRGRLWRSTLWKPGDVIGIRYVPQLPLISETAEISCTNYGLAFFVSLGGFSLLYMACRRRHP